MLNLLSEYTDNILKSLGVFWKGMLAILLVIVLVIAATSLMNYIDKKSKQKKAAKEQALSPDEDNKKA